MRISIFLLACSLLGAVSPVFCFAEGFLLPSQNEAWIRNSLEVMEEKSGQDPTEWKTTVSEKDRQIAQQILDRSVELAKDQLNREALEKTDHNFEENEGLTVIFITLGEPGSTERSEAKRLLRSLSGSDRKVAVVFRGIPAGGRSIGDLVRTVRSLLDDLKDPPTVNLDPERFRKYHVTLSPTILYEKDGKAIAWAEGIASPEWLHRQMEFGRKGDLGVYGQTYALAEEDMFETIRKRILAIDWEKKKERAQKRFFETYDYVDLPTTETPETYALSTRFVATRDIEGHEGELVVRKGQSFDPFDYINPTFYLVVFDASDQRQVKIAKELGRRAQGLYRVKYITTRLPEVEDGWKGYAEIEKGFNAPVYLLFGQLADTFNLQHVPSTVWAQNRRIIVQEHAIPAAEHPKQGQ